MYLSIKSKHYAHNIKQDVNKNLIDVNSDFAYNDILYTLYEFC